MVNGKQKGGAFEREVSKKLSLWLSSGERDDLLWRSSMSGGRATIQLKQGKINKTQTGDISAIDPVGHQLTDNFLVECKSYRKLDILSGFLQNRGALLSFWKKLCKDSKLVNKCPMLIAKQNRLPTLLLVKSSSEFSVLAKVAEFEKWPCSVYLFEDFLKENTPNVIKRQKVKA